MSANTSSAYLNINLSDSFAEKVTDGTQFTIEVDYYDMDNGVFNVNYDALDNVIKETDIQYVGSDQKWKTASFTVSDAYFGNGLDGFDLRVCVRSQKINRSMGNVIISEVRIIKEAVKNAVLVKSIESSELGNIFGNGEQKHFDITLENMTDEIKNIDAVYTAFDKNQNVCWTKNEKLELKPKKKRMLDIEADIKRYGLYDLTVTVTDGVFTFSKSVPFSYVNTDENGRKNDKFGYNTHFGRVGYDTYDGFEVLGKSNAGFVRKSFYWSDVERSKGNLDLYQTYGDFVDAASKCNFDVQCILAYGNTQYGMSHAQTYPITDEQMDAFVRYCEYITNEIIKNGVDVQSYEIWNEPNLKSFNQTQEPATSYAKLVSKVENAVHRILPQAELGMLALANIHAESTKSWAKQVLDSGLVNKGASLTLHNYNYGSYPEDVIVGRMQPYKDMFKEKYGKVPATHLTEWGYSSYSGIAESEYIQGIYDVRQYLYMIGNDICDTCTYYDFANDGAIKTYLEHMHGAIASQDSRVTETPYAAKESFVGFTNMNKLLCNAECVKVVSAQPGLYAYMYQREDDKKNVAAFWTRSEPNLITLKLDCNKIKLYDWFGNSRELVSDDGNFIFTANEEPYYIEGDFTDCSLEDNLTELSTMSIVMSQGDSLMLKVKNQSDEYVTSIEKGTDGIEVVETSNGVYTVSSKAYIGKKDNVYISLKRDGLECGYLKIDVDTTEPINANLFAGVTGAETINCWKGHLILTNNYASTPISGKVTVISPESIARNMPPVEFDSIPGGCTAEIVFDLPQVSRMGMQEVKYRIDTDNGISRTYEQKTTFTAAVLTDSPPVIDGIIDKNEWNRKAAFTADDSSQVYMSAGRVWNGKNDLSSETNIMFDKDNLYMCVNVLDDKFYGDAVDENIWQNDSVQFGVTFENKVTDVMIGGTFTELAVSKTPNGDIVWRSMAENNELPVGKVENAEIAVKRNGNYTCYELKLYFCICST